MEHAAQDLVRAFALIGVLGVGAQWLAWRLNLPAIVMMAIAGLLVGPAFGIIRPGVAFGEFYQPMISVAVAIILFEGGLQLKFSELRGLGKGIGQLVLIGAPLAWILGSVAGHFIAGLSWPVAIVFAGIMIVTGPTVIMPLLRQAKLSTRPAAVLKWEGIINDPIGALAAVIAFEFFYTRNLPDLGSFELVLSLLIGTVMCTAIGIVIGLFLARSFRRGWVPEYLKSPILLAAVLLAFVAANALQEEGGLLSVTAMGITMANAKMPSINQLRHFKENIAVLFVAGVFVILTANLTPQVLAQLDWRMMAFVAAMLLIVRPAAVLLSTIGTELKLTERLLVAWIAPRGIVAVAVSGLFAAAMSPAAGFEDGALMVPLSFAMVFATVVLHGFTIAPLGRWLGLASTLSPGVLIVGASPWSIELARRIKELDVPVLLADPSFRALRPARQSGVPTYYGEILSEVSEHHVEFVRYGYLLALSANEAHNALVCTDLAAEMDRAKVYQLSTHGGGESRTAVSYVHQGRFFLDGKTSLEELMRRHYAGWEFHFTRLSEEFPPEKFLENEAEGALIVMVQRKGQLIFQTDEMPIKLQVGDRVLAYNPPEKTRPIPEQHEEDSEAVEELEAKKREVIDDVTP